MALRDQIGRTAPFIASITCSSNVSKDDMVLIQTIPNPNVGQTAEKQSMVSGRSRDGSLNNDIDKTNNPNDGTSVRYVV